MTVYVVCQQREIVGIFSTEILADQFIVSNGQRGFDKMIMEVL
jgi:hypothetical protein